eukprot:m.149094 g.149094  ORF g.149094 m.149094 type:complete len:429 (-) comp14225_c0_seq2:181-1467(-)
MLLALVQACVVSGGGVQLPASAAAPTPSCGEGCRRWVFPDAVTTHGARCLDGSPPALYHRPGRGTDASNFLVYANGGCWCYDFNQSDTSDITNCLLRSQTYLGSSDARFNPDSGPPTTQDNMSGGIMSTNCSANPQFCNWSVVFLVYCDGSSWSSDREAPHVVNGTQIWSRGLRNLHALWDRMLTPAKYNATTMGVDLSAARRIVVTGASAGGFATFYHCDRVRAMIPSSIPTHCVPDCGFWPESQTAQGRAVWKGSMEAMVELHSAVGGLDSSCVAAHPADPSYCAHPVNLVPYITTPIFISSSLYDTGATYWVVLPGGAPPSWPTAEQATLTPCFEQTYAECHPGYARNVLTNWTATIRAGLTPAVHSPSSGYFMNACYRHHNIDGDEAFTTRINGVSLVEAVANWVLGLGGPTKLIDAGLPSVCP